LLVLLFTALLLSPERERESREPVSECFESNDGGDPKKSTSYHDDAEPKKPSEGIP
jgi:hypothetical protein